MTTWSDSEDAELIERWGRGESAVAIATALGRPAEQVYSRLAVLRGRGVDLPLRRRRLTPAEQALLIRRRSEGITINQLALEFGVDRRTITRHQRKLRGGDQ